MRRLSVRLSDDDGARLHEEAERRGVTEAEVVRIAVERFLARPREAPKPAAVASKRQSAFGGSVEEVGTVRRRPL